MKSNISINQCSATLRIMEAPEIHDEITSKLKPSRVHKKGDIRYINNKKTNKKWDNNHWSLSSPLSDEKVLTEHIKWICDKIYPHCKYIKHLIEKDIKIDLFCSVTTDCDDGNFALEPEIYNMLSFLKIPLTFSLILLEDFFE